MTEGTASLAALDALARRVAEEAAPDAVFAAAAAAADGLIGHALFTVMRFDAATMEVERAFSSRPDVYPVGGRKPKRDTSWGRHVLEEGRPFIGIGPDDLRASFSDHETIASLGLATVLNMPVSVSGRTLGTVNLLRGGPPYGPADLAPARVVATLLAPRLAEA